MGRYRRYSGIISKGLYISIPPRYIDFLLSVRVCVRVAGRDGAGRGGGVAGAAAAAAGGVLAARGPGRQLPGVEAVLPGQGLVLRRAEGAHQRHHRGPERQAVLLRPRLPQAGRLLQRLQGRLWRWVVDTTRHDTTRHDTARHTTPHCSFICSQQAAGAPFQKVICSWKGTTLSECAREITCGIIRAT